MRHINNVPELITGQGRTPTSGVWDARAVAESAWVKGDSNLITTNAANLVSFHDFTSPSTWPGSGVALNNIEPTPADSAAQSAYDLRRGNGATSTTYPTMTVAGALYDGGDYMSIAANTTFINSLHQNNAAFAFGAVIWLPAALSAQTHLLATARSVAQEGIAWMLNDGATKPALYVFNGSGVTTFTADTALSGGFQYLGLTIDEAGSGFFRVNKAYNQVSASNTFTAAYTSPGSGSAADTMKIGSQSDASTYFLPNKAGVVALALFNNAMSAANHDSLYDELAADPFNFPLS